MIRLALHALFVAAFAAGSAAAVAGAPASPFGAASAVKERPITLPSSGALAFRGAIAMRPPFAAFGGISGVVAEGDGLVAVSDRGQWLRFRPVIKGGRLVGAENASSAPLLNDAGAALSKRGQDAEDIAPGGWVSFEGDHRIARYDEPGGPAVETLRHPDWEKLRSNGGLEAVAQDAKGQIWAIAERSWSETTPFPVFIWNGVEWAHKALPRKDAYAVTTAAFAPDGALYLVERRFGLLAGFRTRIRRVVWGTGTQPESDEVLLHLGRTADNLEAAAFLSVDGRLHLILASDDNFQPLQRNILALYEVLG